MLRQKKSKFIAISFSLPNRSGIILLVVLWVMAILTVLAVSLGIRTSMDMALTKYSIGKTKSYSLAWAGVVYAADLIKKDSQDPVTSPFDTLYACGLTLPKEKTPEEMLKAIPLGEGYFDISYTAKDMTTRTKVMRYGFVDEERKINLNAIDSQNYKVLGNLISLLGFDSDTGETIASSVVDWHDTDTAITNSPLGAEDNYYKDLPKAYPCKNAAFESPEELLLIKGVTPEIFNALKDYVTVFPQDSTGLFVNENTAPEIILRAMARNLTGPMTNTQIADADSMAAKIIAYRNGEDGQEFTADDRLIKMNELELNEKEQVLYLALKGQLVDVSRFFRIHVKGNDSLSSIHTDIEAVIDKNDSSAVFWHRD